MPGVQAFLYCFTVHGTPPPASFDAFDLFVQKLVKWEGSGKIEWCVYGHEICPTTQRLHLQGAFWFKKLTQKSNVARYFRPEFQVWLGRPGEEKGPEFWLQYCSKENLAHQFGNRPSEEHFQAVVGQGKRSELRALADAIEAGNQNRKALRKEFDAALKHRDLVDVLIDDYDEPVPIKSHPLYPWQADLYQELQRDPDDRTIIFVVDLIGNTGKTWFTKYVAQMLPRVQKLQPGKKEDIAYMLDKSNRIFLFDCPRAAVEYLNYTFLETIKNGEVFSPKYQSRMKYFPIPHLVVFMNEFPDQTKLSADRWKIIEVQKP